MPPPRPSKPDALTRKPIGASGPGGAIARLRACLPTLQPSDARVARAILAEPDATVCHSVSEVAEAAQVSTATVVRCAQKAGFRGFQDLKLALAQDTALVPVGDEAGRSSLVGVLEAGVQTLRDAATLVDPEEFAAAATAIARAGRVLFVGVGTSSAFAVDAAYRFETIGIHAVGPADVHAQHVIAHGLAGTDACVAISHSGSTRETLAALDAANAAGATTIAITSFSRSPLTEAANRVLVAGARELTLHLEAVSSRLAHLAVLDALLLDVLRRKGKRAYAALDRYTTVVSDHHL